MKSIFVTMLFLASSTVFAQTLYFSCNVKEEANVIVRFAIGNYVRDYGPAYRGEIDFKQFISCKVSTRVL